MEDAMEIEEPLIEQFGRAAYRRRDISSLHRLQLRIQSAESQSSLKDEQPAERNISELSPAIQIAQPISRNSCKKNSLKFCRKLSKMLLDKLNSKNSEPFNPHSSLVAFFQKALEQQINLLFGSIKDSEDLQTLHIELIKKVWERNRDILSEKKNNRLSLVNFEEWGMIYSFQGFSEYLFASSHNLELVLSKITFGDESSLKTFIGFYSKLLYTLNVLILNFTMFVQLPQENNILNLIPELENFEIMTKEPWLYKHYNHTKAKFATECCSNCKICRSSLLPIDFKERLANARSRHQAVKNIFQKRLSRWDDTQENDIDFAIIPVLVYNTWM